jgi:hypothetical protein
MKEQSGRRKLVRAGEEGKCDREVESRSLLAQRRGCQIDRDSVPLGPGKQRIDDPAVHPVLCLLARPVGESDDRERREIGREEMCFDVHPARLESDNG